MCLAAWLVTGAVFATRPASATTIYSWNNPSGGAATTSTNWSPNGVPQSADATAFTLGSTYTVTWASPADSLQNVEVEAGHPTFSIASHLGLTSTLDVLGGATLTIAGGTVWTPLVRSIFATAGFLVVSGVTSELDASQFDYGCTGCPGPGYAGTFEVSSGARLFTRGAIDLATNANEYALGYVHGQVRVGFPLPILYFPTMRTVANGPFAPDFIVGGNGFAQLSVYDGGYVYSAGDLFVGRYSQGNGFLGTTTGTHASSIVVQGQAFLGANDEGGTPGGQGSLYFENGYGQLNGRCWLGDPDDLPATSARGSLGVGDGGNAIVAGGITMSAALSGGFFLGGGITQVIGGPNTIRQFDPVAIGGYNSAQLWLENGTTTDFSANTAYDPRALRLGPGGTGMLRVAGPGTTLNIHGDTELGSTDGAGTAEIDTTGTAHFLGAVMIGGDAQNNSNLTTNGAGSTATIQDSLVVGFPSVTQAEADVESLSTVTVSGPLVLGNGGDGAVVVDDGTLTVTGPTRVGGTGNGSLYVNSQGHATLAGVTEGPGTGSVAAATGGRIDVTDHFDLTGDSFAGTDSSGIITYNGGARPLSVGAGYPTLWINSGGLVQASSEIDVRGELVLAAGTGIVLDARTAARDAVRAMRKRVAQVAVSPAHSQIASGGPPGVVQCPLMRVLGDGVLDGLGTIQGRVHMDSGTTKFYVVSDVANGRTIAGDSTKTDGFVSIGWTTIATGDTLLPLDADGADLGKIHLDGGDLQLRKPGHLKSGFRLDGIGTVEGSLDVRDSAWVSMQGVITGDLALAGTVDLNGQTTPSGLVAGEAAEAARSAATADATSAPAALPAAASATQATRTLSLGTLHAAGTGRATVLIGPGGFDQIAVSGTAVLGGTLDVRTTAGQTPGVGSLFTVVTAGAVSGTFTAVTVNGHPNPGTISVLYGATNVRVVVLGAITGVGDGEPAPPATPTSLRFAALGGPRDAALALDLPAPASVRVTLYDVGGRQVVVVADGELEAGRHRYELGRCAGASGMYFARAEVRGATGTQVLVTRAVVLR
ncbi:MAG: hypothetical protein ACHQ52_12575 [Candidatus Eisenbacteria bacterium]